MTEQQLALEANKMPGRYCDLLPISAGMSDAIPLRDLLSALQDLKMLIELQPVGSMRHPSGKEVRDTASFQRASEILFRFGPKYFESTDGGPVVDVVGFTVARPSEGIDSIKHYCDLVSDVRAALAERGIQVLRTTTAKDVGSHAASAVLGQAVERRADSLQRDQL